MWKRRRYLPGDLGRRTRFFVESPREDERWSTLVAGYTCWAAELCLSRSHLMLLAVDAGIVADDAGVSSGPVRVNYVAWEDVRAQLEEACAHLLEASSALADACRAQRTGSGAEELTHRVAAAALTLEHARDRVRGAARLLRRIDGCPIVRDPSLVPAYAQVRQAGYTPIRRASDAGPT